MRPTLLETEAQDRKQNVTRTFSFFSFRLLLANSGCRGFCSVTGQEALVNSTTILPRIFPRRKKRELLFTQKRSRTNKQSTETKQNKTETNASKRGGASPLFVKLSPPVFAQLTHVSPPVDTPASLHATSGTEVAIDTRDARASSRTC